MPLMKEVVRLSLFASILLSLCSCRALSEADIPGTYVATTSWGKATLRLKSDHSFEQTVAIDNDKNVKKLTGKWSLENGVLGMAPCLAVNHHDKGVYAGGCGTSIDNLGFGRVEIAADPDAGINYRR